MWHCTADGRDPRAPHRNYPNPHSMLSGFDHTDKRSFGPAGDFHIRAVPGVPGKYIAVAGHHHGTLPGTPMLFDTRIEDDNEMAQTKILVGNCLPEENTRDEPAPGCNDGPHKYYYTPYALDENFYLITREFNRDYAPVLLDRFGNEIYLYGDGFCPQPIKVRSEPNPQAPKTYQGERRSIPDRPKAVISVQSVYESDFEWPAGEKVTGLRIIQVLPRPWSCPCQDEPTQLGFSSGAIPRTVLGTVPVEDDGSAYFEAPIETELYFQALDSLGMAIQSMRSGTYVHPGEHLSCTGCHESKWNATPVMGTPKALLREPSKITPDVDGSLPLNFHRLVKPVFRDKCIPCHTKEGKGPTYLDSYEKSLSKLAFYFNASGAHSGVRSERGGYRTVAGRFGARESKMGKALMATHKNRITPEEFHRVTLWLDANSMELTSCTDFEAQRRGEVVWPLFSCGPDNPQCLDIEGKGHPDWTPVKGLVDEGLLSPSAAKMRFQLRAGIIQITNPTGEPFVVDIYDMSGRNVASVHSGGSTLKAPTVHVSSPFNSGPGTYLARIETVSRKFVQKVTLME